MITFVMSPEVLGRTRFALSPLAETTMSLRILGNRSRSPLFEPWARDVCGRLDDVDMDLLQALVPQGRLIASCLLPQGRVVEPSIDDQLDALANLDPEALRCDLEDVWSGCSVPDRLARLLDSGSQVPTHVAQLMRRYWDIAIQPFWPRIRAVLEDDVGYRLALLVAGGYYSLLDDLHPELQLEGNKLHINKPHFPDSEHEGSAMVLTPSVFAWPTLVIEDQDEGLFTLTYGTRGIARVWDGESSPTEDRGSLTTLLGRTRASVLRSTGVPMSTTQLARELAQSPASVNDHLKALRAAGLLSSRRSGRSVLYRRTALGEEVVRAEPRPPGSSYAV